MSLTDMELNQHLALVQHQGDGYTASSNPLIEQLRTTPLFSSVIHSTVSNSDSLQQSSSQESILPQYGLLGLRTAAYQGANEEEDDDQAADARYPRDNLVYTNINAPWSTFICGSQGSGKSHTLSCMLENALLHPSETGKVSSALTGLVLHYDKFTGFDTGQLCEAAYLCSSNIPVRVLVSPSSYERMNRLYSNLPGLPESCPRPIVKPLKFREDHLSIAMMKSLMAVGSGDGSTPLYMEVSYADTPPYPIGDHANPLIRSWLSRSSVKWPLPTRIAVVSTCSSSKIACGTNLLSRGKAHRSTCGWIS